jgi:hypothetical protein
MATVMQIDGAKMTVEFKNRRGTNVQQYLGYPAPTTRHANEWWPSHSFPTFSTAAILAEVGQVCEDLVSTMVEYEGNMKGKSIWPVDARCKCCCRYFKCRSMEAQHRGLEYIPNVSRALVGANDRTAARNSTTKGYLHGVALQKKVEAIVAEFTTDEKIRESMHQQQTQENEANNRKYLAKTPKDRDYTGSSSYATRISLSVNEVNRGTLKTHTMLLARAGLDIGGWGKRALQFIIDTVRKSIARKSSRGARAGRRHKKKVMSAEEAAKEGELSRDDYKSQAHTEGAEAESKVRATVESIVARVDFGFGFRDGKWQDGDGIVNVAEPEEEKTQKTTTASKKKKTAAGGAAPKRARRSAADMHALAAAAAKEAADIDWVAIVTSRELEEGSRGGKIKVADLKGYCTLHSINCKGAKLRVLQRLVIDHVQKIVATIPDTNTFLLIFINSLWLKPRASSSSHLAD